ncbi:YdcF family protein [Oceanobacillus piezotolerans]|uniref:YdcF family protein n=1 Tax=Oceanobacillus piezotolerans TaxID=2448030 RepID=A0A498DR80_9BACI|nr:YdcF family protein [Oceanobacillus piezotolerans]RLL46969.1 YdcF family protein [Oceanobacillus piezotolerans]
MKKRYWFIGIFILFVMIVVIFLRFGGVWLVAEDNIEEVDNAVIVLLMGSVADRALGAADLYEQVEAEQIFIVRSHITGYEELQQRGISLTGDADNSKKVLIETGVPEEDITIVPGDAQSTKDEAMEIAEFLKGKQDVDTILLVTSKYHSQRSKLIFNKTLKEFDIDIYSVPTPYDPYQARGWYKDREDIQRVATEYLKLAHYFFLEQFQINNSKN